MQCNYCRWHAGGHSSHCPRTLSGEAKEEAMSQWKAGFALGESSKDYPDDATLHFKMGWTAGDARADEKANH